MKKNRIPCQNNLSIIKSIHIYMFFAFLVKKTSEYYFLAQAFANLHGKRCQAK